ncbi:MAG: GGDEF domain-containing protein [Boseongicola sp.]|nr:GGDEF domain-containing protein [Boseongicola sp.]
MIAVNVIVGFGFYLFEVWLHGGQTAYYLEHHVFGMLLFSAPLSCFGLAALGYLSKLRAELAHLATTGLLTGLNNRRAFMAAAELATSQSGGILMMLDLDHFKKINDTYGHTVGDDCLRAIADVLREQVRAEDIIGRLGGEEFGVFLVDAPLEAARHIGERLSAGAELSLAEADRVLYITASIGAVEMPEKDDLETVLTLADMAMYQAKDEGRARLVFWEKGVTARAMAASA